mmetsp:Transcript_33633/g.76824  ORF Transcript_33633/g.76824 Transcript_33633/m.76824 type:complete len:202 (-) Transcript_33633:79-684(-)
MAATMLMKNIMNIVPITPIRGERRRRLRPSVSLASKKTEWKQTTASRAKHTKKSLPMYLEKTDKFPTQSTFTISRSIMSTCTPRKMSRTGFCQSTCACPITDTICKASITCWSDEARATDDLLSLLLLSESTLMYKASKIARPTTTEIHNNPASYAVHSPHSPSPASTMPSSQREQAIPVRLLAQVPSCPPGQRRGSWKHS